MKQPSKVKIKNCADKTRYSLPSTAINCVLQDREEGDKSEIVYINNPLYTAGSRTEAPLIPFTKYEYTVVSYTK